MKKATLFVLNNIYHSNKIFDEKSDLNRDDCLRGFINLKKKFNQSGIDLSTQDINKVEESEFVIYNDYIPKKIQNKNSYLLLFESKLIKPENWNLVKHKKFSKIFTWDNDLIDNKKYFKINFSQNLSLLCDIGVKPKHLTQMSANKFSKSKLELYSERRKIIQWHENNNIEFDFFGPDWNYYRVQNRWFNFILTRVNIKRNFKNYKGISKSKYQNLKDYNFSYCLENFYGQNGYVTEKIIDCFKTLTIPIYKGHQNISKQIPEDTFINYDDFKNLKDLNNYLLDLSNNEILEYQKNIKNFMNSKNSHEFSNDFFVNQISLNID